MGRRITLALVLAGVAGVGVLVGRSTAPLSVVAATRHAEADAGLDRIVPDLDFRNAPCGEVFAWLRQRTGANLHIDWAALEAEGIDRAAPVSLRLRGLPLRRVLDVLCEQTGGGTVSVGYQFDRGVIEVSSELDLSRNSVFGIYDARDLVKEAIETQLAAAPVHGLRAGAAAPAGGTICFPGGTTLATPGAYEEATTILVELIRETVSPEAWRDNGGWVGTIRVFDGRLIIGGTPRMHAQIDALLAQLREGGRGGSEGGGGEEATRAP